MRRRYPSLVHAVLLGISSAGLGVGACDDSSKEMAQLARLADRCALNSECRSPLVCTFERCHEQCSDSRDCPMGQRCVRATASQGVCQLPVEASCKKATDCLGYGQTCAEDRKCHDVCQSESNCLGAEQCTSTGVCADARELDEDGNLLEAAGGGAGEDGNGGKGGAGRGGSSGKGGEGTGGMSSGNGGGTGGGSANGGTGNAPAAGEGQGAASGDAGGEAGTGGLSCQGVLPNGTCSYCPPGACGNGDCVSGVRDYSCECWPGFSGTGTRDCQLDDPCSANLKCTADYPCVPTQIAGGYSCVGEFASWPMPDRETGGSATPTYAGTDDTVVDQLTGLEWQRVTPADCTLADSDAGASPCDSVTAKAYCGALDLGGKTDWRVPSLIELESLLDCTQTFKPLIDTAAFPATSAGGYLSSSPIVGKSQTWVVDFNIAQAISNYGISVLMRCVRGSGLRPSTPKTHYTVMADDSGGAGAGSVPGGVVLDNWTGLAWQRDVPDAMIHADAQAHCDGLGGGFRLPTLKELFTLVDPQRLGPAIDTDAFPATPNESFWASTPSGSSAHVVRFGDGSSTQSSLDTANRVRCVRF